MKKFNILITGPQGTGKTTLARVLSNFYMPKIEPIEICDFEISEVKLILSENQGKPLIIEADFNLCKANQINANLKTLLCTDKFYLRKPYNEHMSEFLVPKLIIVISQINDKKDAINWRHYNMQAHMEDSFLR